MCGYTGHEFGARYPDSICIDGFLWDADSGDDDGLTHGGDWACPRCNTARFIEDAAEEYSTGSCGTSMGYSWVEAEQFERVVAKAHAENPDETARVIPTIAPFQSSDWPDRQAVRDRRAPWDDTIEVTVDPVAILAALRSTHPTGADQ
jgi:hypothetical protein